MHTTLRRILYSLILGATCISNACNKPTTLFPQPVPPAATQPAAFASDDRQIIEAAVLSLITDAEYHPNRAQGGHYDSIGLLDTTRAGPCKSKLEDMQNCPGISGLTPEARMADCRRNETTYSLEHAGWDPRIILVEKGKYPPSSLAGSEPTFEDTHPTSNGLIAARMPIYIGDGSQAYLNVWFNWSMHGAQAEFSLRRIDGVWRVQRRVIIYFF